MLGILTVNWKPRPLCLMEEGPRVRPPGSLERRDGGGVCRIEFPGLQSSDFPIKSFATLEEVRWPSNCLTLWAVIVNFLALELAWPIVPQSVQHVCSHGLG